MPLTSFIDGTSALAQRYQQVQVALSLTADRPVHFRVAASIGHLGLVARLLCPAFGLALLARRIDLTRAWWQPTLGGVMPLAVPREAIGKEGPAARSPVLDLPEPIFDLVQRTAELSVSRKVLWGNVASAVNGAVTTAAAARPDLAERSMSLGTALLRSEHLTRASVGSPGSAFRRRSCCLIYRMGPLGTKAFCGDCVLFR